MELSYSWAEDLQNSSPQKDNLAYLIERIVGVDPGTHRMGLACIEKKNNSYRLVEYLTVTAPKDLPVYDRLGYIQKGLKEFLEKTQPHVVSLEDIFFAKNIKSAFTIGLARGVVFAACLERSIRIFEYPPTKVKSAVTGSGRADKSQVQKMLSMLLGVKLEVGFDTSDAIAIALCHGVANKPYLELK